MALSTWRETLLSHRGDGTALTAAATASLLQGATATRAKYTFPPNFFEVNKAIRMIATGRISTVITTPGTARFDMRFGSITVWDSLAISLATAAAHTNVHWTLDVTLLCQAAGDTTTATLFPGFGAWYCEDIIATGAPTAGPTGLVLLPFNTAPAVGTGFDSTASQQLDLRWTQTAATGSITLHTFMLEALN